MGFPSYKAIAHLPLAEQVTAMRDPTLRQRMLSERSTSVAGDGSPLPQLADHLLAQLDFVSRRTFHLCNPSDYEPSASASLWMEAQAKGVRPLEVVYDAMLEDDGRALLYFPLYNYTGMNLDVVQQMLTHPLSLPGLSDAGAHVGTVCDASFPTFLLTHWGRDRDRGQMPIEHLVQLQARDTARHVGLTDRGEILPGQRADVNIIDFDRLTISQPCMRADLPAGGKRLLQHAHGYVATFVAGQQILANDQLTGLRPGRVVRHAGQG